MKQLDPELTEKGLNEMIEEADTNKDGRIDFNEFAKMMGDQ